VFDRHIHAVNTDNGQGRWISDQAGAGFDTSPLLVNNKVIAGNRDGYLYAFDNVTGKLLWKYKTDGPILFSAAYYDGKIYLVSSDMHAYALTESGSLVWKSAALPSSGFNSWWPVVYQSPGTDRSKDRIIISGGWNYREDMGPEYNKKFTEMQAAEAFPSSKQTEGAELL
jgi:outer membrane protein assembly factor BamB